MKKSVNIISFATLLFVLSGCLKDDDFKNEKYGIQIKEVKGVAFPRAAGSPVETAITASAAPVTINGPAITLEQTGAASADITIAIKDNRALVSDYNEGKEEDQLTLLPEGSYTFNTLTPAIEAGTKFTDELKIAINNSSALDPNKRYAIGVSITSVNQGYTVAENMRNLIIAIPIKNIYDGIYKSTGYFYHPSSSRDFLFDEKNVETAGPNSVIVDLADLGSSNYRMLITVDPVTNKLTVTAAPGAAGGSYTMYDALPVPYTGQWSGSDASNNTYDPATKTFYIRVGYSGGTRVAEEKLVFVEPRH